MHTVHHKILLGLMARVGMYMLYHNDMEIHVGPQSNRQKDLRTVDHMYLIKRNTYIYI